MSVKERGHELSASPWALACARAVGRAGVEGGHQPSWAPHLNEEDSGEDGAGNAYFGTSVDEEEERVSLEEELGDDEVGSRGHLLLQVLQVGLKALGIRVAFGVPCQRGNSRDSRGDWPHLPQMSNEDIGAGHREPTSTAPDAHCPTPQLGQVGAGRGWLTADVPLGLEMALGDRWPTVTLPRVGADCSNLPALSCLVFPATSQANPPELRGYRTEKRLRPAQPGRACTAPGSRRPVTAAVFT